MRYDKRGVGQSGGRVESVTIADYAEDARQVHDALTGFIGLGRMLAPKKQPELQRVFDGLQVLQEGQRITVKVAEPEELAGKFIDGWLKQ